MFETKPTDWLPVDDLEPIVGVRVYFEIHPCDFPCSFSPINRLFRLVSKFKMAQSLSIPVPTFGTRISEVWREKTRKRLRQIKKKLIKKITAGVLFRRVTPEPSPSYSWIAASLVRGYYVFDEDHVATQGSLICES